MRITCVIRFATIDYRNLLTRFLTGLLYSTSIVVSIQGQESDSLKLSRSDSLAKIPLQILAFAADRAQYKNALDTNASFLLSHRSNEIGLHNFYSPRFRMITDFYNQRIYDHGIHSMNFIREGFDDYQLLLPNKPIAEIATHRGRAFLNSQASFQDNFDIRLIFAENFRNRLLWNFSYDKYSYKGIYSHGLQKNTLFKTCVHYAGKKDQFHLNIIFLDERHRIENNWGIQSDSIFNNSNYDIRESAPINISTAKTNIDEKTIGFNMDFPLFRNSPDFHPVIFIKSYYSDYAFSYSDPTTDSSQVYYQNFWVDSNEINHTLKQKSWINALRFEWPSGKKFHGEMGIRHEVNLFDHDTLETHEDTYQLSANLSYQFSKGLKTKANISLKGVAGHIGTDFSLGVRHSMRDLCEGSLNLFLNSQALPYLYSSFVLNKNYVWHEPLQLDFIKETGVSLQFTWKKRIPIEITLQGSKFDHFVYLDSISQPAKRGNVGRWRVDVSLPFNFKWLRLHSDFHYSAFTPDPAHFSAWRSGHTLSLHSSLFKNVVNAEFGIALQLYDFDYRLNFNPLLQSFYSSNRINEMISSLGAFAHFRVSDFIMKLDFENLETLWKRNRPSLVNSYPFYDFFFRFGLQWKFLN